MESSGTSMGPVLYKRGAGIVCDVNCCHNNAGPVISVS